MIRPSVCKHRMQKQEIFKAEPKGMQINYVYIVLTDSTSMFQRAGGGVGGWRRRSANPSLLDLIVRTMDGVSCLRRILYRGDLVRSTLLGIMEHIQLAPVNSER